MRYRALFYGRESGSFMNITESRVVKKEMMTPAQSLCTRCGICCNGVLFVDVELRKADSAARLEALHFELFAKGRKLAFEQPCRCLDGSHCSVYESRPAHCRAFKCALLQQVGAGKATVASALQTIARAKRMVKRVEGMLSRSGEDDPALPLMHRYAKVVGAPMELSGRKGRDPLKGLMPVMADLMELLRVRFLAR